LPEKMVEQITSPKSAWNYRSNQTLVAGSRVVSSLRHNRLNYSSSSALVIAIQLILTQCTSSGTTRWSVRSPPDATTVQQDRSRFTLHEGEFTAAQQLINFKFTKY
jgi:hypothetical protein